MHANFLCKIIFRGPAQKVKLGMISTNSRKNVQELLISQKIPHTNYKPPSKYDDIALIKLAQAVQFTPTVRPACLNGESSITNTKAIAIGFGKTTFGINNFFFFFIFFLQNCSF